MKQPDGTVSIEGFSDAVQPPTEADLELLEGMPFETLGGEDRSYFEELFFEPSLNISGIVSGHTGVGKRAIIPGEAGAKLDIRLVPEQDPDAVFDQLQAHIRSYEKTHMPEELEVSFEMQSRVEPNRTAPDEPVVEPVIRAVRKAWNCDPIVQPIAGGSGPDYVFEEIGLPVILVTYGNADENQHGPNENIALPSFRQGIRATIGMFENVASLRT
jgi:acetylornithine deacetylase/succinyl-diaminopimelate desuccinylase-like protein